MLPEEGTVVVPSEVAYSRVEVQVQDTSRSKIDTYVNLWAARPFISRTP